MLDPKTLTLIPGFIKGMCIYLKECLMSLGSDGLDFAQLAQQ